jgi:integrase
MGWTRKTPAGHWRASYRDPDRKTVSKTFALRRDAERWLRTHEGKIDSGEYLDPRRAKKPFGTYWTAFLAGSEIRPTTRARYVAHHRLYVAETFDGRAIGSIRPEDVRAWRAGLVARGVGAATVEAATRLLKTVLNRAVEDELIARSPARHVENPSTAPAGGLRVLEAEELARLSDAHPERYRGLVWLLGTRGLRIGEASALRVGDVDLMRGSLAISKTLSEVEGELVEGPPKTDSGARTVSLPPFLRDVLAEHLARFSKPRDPAVYVFTTPGGGPGRKEGEGGPIRANNFRKRVFRPAAIAAGLDPRLTPHDLRDTAATLAFSHGATVKEVQRMLGHAKASVTLDRYTGVLESMAARTDERLDATLRQLGVANYEHEPLAGTAAPVPRLGRLAALGSPRS